MTDPPPAAPALDRDLVLADLFRAHHGPLVRTTILLLGDAGVAEEIVQDAYVKLHGALPRPLGSAPALRDRKRRRAAAQRRPVHRHPGPA